MNRCRWLVHADVAQVLSIDAIFKQWLLFIWTLIAHNWRWILDIGNSDGPPECLDSRVLHLCFVSLMHGARQVGILGLREGSVRSDVHDVGLLHIIQLVPLGCNFPIECSR